MNQQADPASTTRGFRVWQLALAIVAVGLILRLGLGALPGPPADQHADADLPPEQHAGDPAKSTESAPSVADLSIVEVLPLDLQGEVPGPLLTAILKRYMPGSTADHADALRDTLPPSEDPRMIVIIPEDETPVF